MPSTYTQKSLKSFEEWPDTQKLADLARAGFYYFGIKDMVKCFFCNGAIKNWDDKQDPYEYHARWFPKCYFIKQVKGVEFVEYVREKYKNDDSGFTNDQSLSGDFYKMGTSSGLHTQNNICSNQQNNGNRSVSPRTINSRLDTNIIRKILDKIPLITEESIKQSIETQLSSNVSVSSYPIKQPKLSRQISSQSNQVDNVTESPARSSIPITCEINLNDRKHLLNLDGENTLNYESLKFDHSYQARLDNIKEWSTMIPRLSFGLARADCYLEDENQHGINLNHSSEENHDECSFYLNSTDKNNVAVSDFYTDYYSVNDVTMRDHHELIPMSISNNVGTLSTCHKMLESPNKKVIKIELVEKDLDFELDCFICKKSEFKNRCLLKYTSCGHVNVICSSCNEDILKPKSIYDALLDKCTIFCSECRNEVEVLKTY